MHQNYWTDPATMEKLAWRGQESYRTKDGAQGKSLLDDDKLLEYNVKRYNPAPCQPGQRHVIDIVPFVVKTSKHPLVALGRMSVGDPDYLLSIYRHRIGPDGAPTVCLVKNYGKACPVCERRIQRGKDPDATDDEIKSLGTGKHPLVVYNVIDHDRLADGVMVWEVSNFFMEMHLQGRAKMPGQIGQGYINYFWSTAGEQGGRHIAFCNTGSGQQQAFTGHEFFIRRQPIPVEILNQAVPLDDLLYVPSYEEIQALLEAGLRQPQQPAQITVDYAAGGLAPGGGTVGCPEFGRGQGLYAECQGCQDWTACAKPPATAAPPPQVVHDIGMGGAPVPAPLSPSPPPPLHQEPQQAPPAPAAAAPRPQPLRRPA